MKYFSTNPEDGWINVRCSGDCDVDTLTECNLREPTIFIVPSGNPSGQHHPKLFVIPYSSHSNYEELQKFVRAIMPFRLSFIVPYMNKGVCTMRGPAIFLKNYVRKKPYKKPEIQNEDKKEEYKIMQEFSKRNTDNKVGNKKRFVESNLQIYGHKGKRLKGATFVNSEAVYSLSLPEDEKPIEIPQKHTEENSKPENAKRPKFDEDEKEGKN